MGSVGSSKLGREIKWQWKSWLGSRQVKEGAGRERNWLRVTVGLVGSGLGGLWSGMVCRGGWGFVITPETPKCASGVSKSIALELWLWSPRALKGFSGVSLALGSGMRSNSSFNAESHSTAIGAVKM